MTAHVGAPLYRIDYAWCAGALRGAARGAFVAGREREGGEGCGEGGPAGAPGAASDHFPLVVDLALPGAPPRGAGA